MNISEKLASAKEKLKDLKVLVLGDSVIDRFTVVEPEGISREAPIPAMSIKKEYFKLGASYNAVKSLLDLSVKPIYITAVGSDPEGEHFIDEVKRELSDAEIVVDEKRNTDSVYRVYANSYLMLWAEKSSKKAISRDAESSIIKRFARRIDEADAVIISDHARGVFSRNVREAVVQNAKNRKIPLIINGRPENISNYAGADYLRMNREDAIKLTGVSPMNSTSYRNMALKLSSMSKVENIIITWLEDGFFGLKGESFFRVDPISFKPSNLRGIGDAIVASFAAFLALGFTFEEATKLSYLSSALRAQSEKGNLYDRLLELASKMT